MITISAFIWAAIVSIPGRCQTEVLFSSQQSVEVELRRLIDGSRSSIDLALFDFRSPALRRALERARRRGVAIRLVQDASRGGGNQDVGQRRRLGGKRRGRRGVMHNKFVIFDRARVVTGSYNWTPGAEYSNYENVLIVDEPAVVQRFVAEFNRLWCRAGKSTSEPRRRSTKRR